MDGQTLRELLFESRLTLSGSVKNTYTNLAVLFHVSNFTLHSVYAYSLSINENSAPSFKLCVKAKTRQQQHLGELTESSIAAWRDEVAGN